jgi:putative flippase GtrA
MPLQSEGLPVGGRPGALTALARRYGRFAPVGIAATLVHVSAHVAGVEFGALSPLAANALGLMLGVNLSFPGHRRWTFRGSAPGRAGRSLARFWLIAAGGLALNSPFVELAASPLGLSYGRAILPIVGITPLAAFALSRSWAFRG